MEPDLFPEMAKNAETQLAVALLRSVTTAAAESVEANLTFGGKNSFYYRVMEELHQQNAHVLSTTVERMVQYYCQLLGQTDSVLDSSSVQNDSSMDSVSSSPTTVVTALTALCLHKSAATALSQLDSFLLPAAGTPEAAATIRPAAESAVLRTRQAGQAGSGEGRRAGRQPT